MTDIYIPYEISDFVDLSQICQDLSTAYAEMFLSCDNKLLPNYVFRFTTILADKRFFFATFLPPKRQRKHYAFSPDPQTLSANLGRAERC